MEKILRDVTIIYVLPLSKIETVLMETVGGRSTAEPQAPWLSHISNAALLSLKLFLSAGRNISSKKWLHDLFLNEDCNILKMIFYSQPRVGHTCWVKKKNCYAK